MSQAIRFRDLYRNKRHAAKRLKGAIKTIKLTKDEQKLKNLTYPAYFEQHVDLYPDNVLVRFEDRVITFSQFNEAANRVANYLADKGYGKGDTIALFMENRPEYLIYQLAITKIGAAAALVNNAQRGRVLIHSVNLVKAQAIIVGEEVLEPLTKVREELCVQDPFYIVPDADTLIAAGPDFADGENIVKASLSSSDQNLPITRTLTSDLPAWYIYTSGTTGLPKASVQKHIRVIKSAAAMSNIVNPITSNDVTYSSLPLYHITSISVCWFPAITHGGCIALSRKFSASRFWDDIAKYKATSFGYVGELCRYLLNQDVQPAEKNNTVTSIVGNGLRPEIWDEFKSRFGIEVVNEIYGASEGNTMAVNLFNLDKTVGMILTPYKLVKVDQETEQPIRCPKGKLINAKKGEPGLLLGEISDLAPFDGYSDTSKNDSKVIRNAFKQGDAYFNTGDVLRNIGYKQLQFCDRTGDTFRWKGENVSTQEVEESANHHSQIEETVAYGVEIPKTNGKAGMMAITLREGVRSLDGEALFEYMTEELPAYAVPIFVRVKDELEKTGTFKYQKTGVKTDGFDISKLEDAGYIALPGEKKYQRLTQEIYDGILAGKYRF